MGCEYFCKYLLFFRIAQGVGEDYVILHHANVFIIEDNILCHLGGPSDHTGSHGNWLNGCKIDLITYPNPCNGYSFPLVFPHFFDIFINIHEYANEIIFI